MTKTIEELIYDFANRQFHKAPINTARDLMCVCSDFANEFLAQPLVSRLTAEEKERVRKEYWQAARDWIGIGDARGYCRTCVALESIFGSDFFKEEE